MLKRIIIPILVAVFVTPVFNRC